MQAAGEFAQGPRVKDPSDDDRYERPYDNETVAGVAEPVESVGQSKDREDG